MSTTTFRGRPACTCLAKWLPVYERELLDLGLIKVEIDIYQLIGAATASAGTHRSGGAFDLAQYTPEQIRVARQMGAATWHRTPAQGFIDHSHGVLKGCPHADPSAARQVASLEAGRNGLASNGADDGPRNVQIPLRTWSEGIAWAKSRQKRRELTVKIRAQRKTVRRATRRLKRLIGRRAAL